MDEHEVVAQLRSRADPASRGAVQRIDAGARWWPSIQVVKVASERRDWTRPEEPYSQTEIIGLDELLSDLSATDHPTLEMATLDHVPAGQGAPDRFLVYLVPGTSQVVACVGVVSAPRPPTPVYEREEVPDTVEAAAAAFSSHRLISGQPYPFEVTVHEELNSAEADRVYSAWPARRKGWYSQAPEISVLGAAKVSVVDPKGQRFEGHLLVLDIPPDAELPRHRHGRIDALILAMNSRGVPSLRAMHSSQYRAV